ncbi:MAG: cytochrome P450 [Azospirillaceae bacterium]
MAVESIQRTDMVNRDVLSDAFKADPYPTYRWWHAHERTFKDPEQGYWLAFDYQRVQALLRDPGLTVERYDYLPREEDREYDAYVRNMLSTWMLNNDGEAHKSARNTLMPLFTSRAILGYEQLVRRQVAKVLDTVADKGNPVEVYSDIAFPLPAQVVMAIMGLTRLGEERIDDIQRFSDQISTYVGSAGRAPGCIKPTHDTIREFADMLLEALKDRDEGFEHSLTARLLEIYGDGDTYEELEDTLSNMILFIVSGFETTTNLINNSFLAIGRNPGLQERLRAEPSLLEDFIDETLRIYPPVNRTARKARRDVEVDGATIPAGDLAILFIGAANRDPKVFPEPDLFKLERPERKEYPVLSFGFGPHLCIGRLLSILEVRVFYEELFRRFDSIAVDVDNVAFRDGSVLKGVSKLDVTLS